MKDSYLKFQFYIFVGFLLANISISTGLAQDEISKANILKQLANMESQSMESFIDAMELVSKQSQEYIKLQEERCSGDYTSFVIDASGERKLQKIKLTANEKKLCKYSLINFQIKITKLAFNARKKYLAQSQKRQMNQLKELNLKRLSELELEAQKYK